jgi:hypothetical protein
MSQLPSTHAMPAAHESTLIARGIGIWLYCGLAGVLLLPAARAHSPAFGWIAYWLVGAPVLMWAMQRRQVLAQRAQAILVGLCAPRVSGVAGAGSPFDRRQGWRHARTLRQARRLRR